MIETAEYTSVATLDDVSSQFTDVTGTTTSGAKEGEARAQAAPGRSYRAIVTGHGCQIMGPVSFEQRSGIFSTSPASSGTVAVTVLSRRAAVYDPLVDGFLEPLSHLCEADVGALELWDRFMTEAPPAEEVLGLERFLMSLVGVEVEEGIIREDVATRAAAFWRGLSARVKGVPEPIAAAGPNGEIGFTWDRGDHHLEVEFSPDGSLEAFYRNRRTRESWHSSEADGEVVIPETEEALRLFILPTSQHGRP